MEEHELPQLHDWSLKASRLLELIALTNRTIQIHQEAGSSLFQISEYRDLLAQQQNELNVLMKQYGLTLQIEALNSAA